MESKLTSQVEENEQLKKQITELNQELDKKDKKIKELGIRLEARKGGRDIHSVMNVSQVKESTDVTFDLSMIDSTPRGMEVIEEKDEEI